MFQLQMGCTLNRHRTANIVIGQLGILIMLLFGKWAKLIPMPALAAILIIVAWNMADALMPGEKDHF